MLIRILAIDLILACCASLANPGEPVETVRFQKTAFFEARSRQTEYAGPGRDDPPPADLDAVLLGYFGPSDPSHPEGGDLWCAAQMAIDEANAAGGYQGKPFRLVPAWSESPWGTGVAEVARMVYREKVWAIIGGIDGPSTHLAEQVVVKARLSLLSPASADKTANLANVPWMFSLLPGDHLTAPLVVATIAERIGRRSFVLISADDHDSRRFASELDKCFGRQRMVPRYRYQCRRGVPDQEQLVTDVLQADPAAVVLAADAHDSARLVKALGESGFSGMIFGGPWMGRSKFAEEAGRTAEGVFFPLLAEPPHGPAPFARDYHARFGRWPDYAAAHTYDSVRMVVAAIHESGLNRARIRDAIEGLSPWAGAGGTVKWDRLGANARIVHLGTIRDGRPVAVGETGRLGSGIE